MTTTVSQQAKDLFVTEFYRERAEYGNTPAHEFRSAGRPTKANPNGEDEIWWLAEGPRMVQRWIDWRKSCPWEIWVTPDGRPAIELELNVEFGGIPVRMFIDRIFQLPQTRALLLVDLKSGKRTPASELQNAFYAAGIKAEYDVDIRLSAFWMARTGELTPVQDISRYTLPLLSFWIKQFAWARENNIFIPNLTELCRACGVNKYCYAYGGKKSGADPDSEQALEIPF